MPEVLTKPLHVQVNEEQIAPLLREGSASFVRLLVVRDIQEDKKGAAFQFHDGLQARVAVQNPNYAKYLHLARRSQERQHPIGVRLDGESVIEITRADNDVPKELWEQPDHLGVSFHGHQGVYRLEHDHPEFVRINALLNLAIQRRLRVWFVAELPGLTLLNVLLSSGQEAMQFTISVVVAPEHLLQLADEILRTRIRCSNTLRRDIRAVAKAYIDEADELNRSIRDIQTKAAKVQIESRSPPEMIGKAMRLRTVQFPNKDLQRNIRAIANSYLMIAEENRRLFDEFKERYRDNFPKTA